MIDGQDKSIQYIRADETNRHLLWEDGVDWGKYPAWVVKIDGMFAGSLEQVAGKGSNWQVHLIFRHTWAGSFEDAKALVRDYAEMGRRRLSKKPLDPPPLPLYSPPCMTPNPEQTTAVFPSLS